MSNLITVEEALRRSHCAHANSGAKGHDCKGVCTITREGIKLSCELCGSEDKPTLPTFPREVEEKAKRILNAAGLNWRKLEDFAFGAVLSEVSAMLCPGCHREMPFTLASTSTCHCKEWRLSRDSWDAGWRRV